MSLEDTMNLEINLSRLNKLLSQIGLYNPKQEFYTQRERKYQQVYSYIIQIKTALNKLSTKRPIIIVDCGCGRSYLSFILYEYCTNVLSRKINIIGIDNNAELIAKCKRAASELNFIGMKFFDSSLKEFTYNDPVDIVYSLHACNTATDLTIAKGVMLGAQYIFSVSCCQHDNRTHLSRHPLRTITRHMPYKERLVDMIGDSMRGLLLEHLGYRVNLFEFVASEHTPKNILLRAIKNAAKKQDREVAISEYKKLVDMFHFSVALENLLSEYL